MPGIQKILLTFMFCASVAQVYAQGTATPPKQVKPIARRVAPKGPPPIKNEISFGYRLATDGWGLYADYGTSKFDNAKHADMFYDVHILQLELAEKKHPQQQKITVEDQSTGNSTNYIYGKINNFYALKLGYGFRKMLAGKPDPGSVSIHWTNVVGGCLGMLKPYYVTLINNESIRYTDATGAEFLNKNYILGNAGFSKGIGEMKMIPGGQLKSMLHFDFATSRKTVTAIETGVSLEYYTEPVAIMYNRKEQQLFTNLFVSFQFGKRW